jgi:hypothetical protein
MIERNYVQERNLDTTHTIDFLQREFIDKGKLGLKSAKGGFFPPVADSQAAPAGPRIFVLDNGLSGQVDNLEKGKVLEYSSAGQYIRTIFEDQYLPDGIVVLKEEGLMFWTCMGYPGQNDGMIYSANLDGSNLQALFEPGKINTPKQIALDHVNKKLYFADREGLCIWRCKSSQPEIKATSKTNAMPQNGASASQHHLAWVKFSGPRKAHQKAGKAAFSAPT